MHRGKRGGGGGGREGGGVGLNGARRSRAVVRIGGEACRHTSPKSEDDYQGVVFL